MKQTLHLCCSIALLYFLSACGGQESVAPVWEQAFEPNSVYPYSFARNFDMVSDPSGNLVSLGNLTVDSDPSTTAIDSAHMVVLTKQRPSDGSLIWESIIPFPNFPDTGFSVYDIKADSEGNLYVAGEGFALKTDRFGQLQWMDYFERDMPSIDVTSITLKNDRVYVSGVITRIYDVHGNLQQTIDNDGAYPWEIVVTDNNHVIQPTWKKVTRHDAEGNLLWSVPSPEDISTRVDIKMDNEGDSYVSFVGNDDSDGTSASAKLMKISADGDLLWSTFIPDNRGTSNYFQAGKVQIHLTSDNQLLNVSSGHNGRQLTRLDTETGALIWEKVYKGTGISDMSYLTEDDILYVVGDYYPQSFDRNGNLLDTFSMPQSTFYNSLVVTSDGFYVASDSWLGDGQQLYSARYPLSE